MPATGARGSTRGSRSAVDATLRLKRNDIGAATNSTVEPIDTTIESAGARLRGLSRR